MLLCLAFCIEGFQCVNTQDELPLVLLELWVIELGKKYEIIFPKIPLFFLLFYFPRHSPYHEDHSTNNTFFDITGSRHTRTYLPSLGYLDDASCLCEKRLSMYIYIIGSTTQYWFPVCDQCWLRSIIEHLIEMPLLL